MEQMFIIFNTDNMSSALALLFKMALFLNERLLLYEQYAVTFGLHSNAVKIIVYYF